MNLPAASSALDTGLSSDRIGEAVFEQYITCVCPPCVKGGAEHSEAGEQSSRPF